MDNITLGRYMPLDSIVHRMDPRAKMIILLLVMVAIFIPSGWLGYGILTLVLSTVVLLSKFSFRYIWKSMRPMLLMMCFLLLINVSIIKTGPVWFMIGTFAIHQDAVMQTAYIIVRLLLMIMVTTTLTATTKPLDLTMGIEDLLQPFGIIGCPYHEIAMLISIALRFIPDLIDETQRIMKAQESRGVDMKEGSFKEKIQAILSLIVPLFVSAFQRAEDLANAMEARGYMPGEPRTRYKVLKMTGPDYLALTAAVGLLCLLIRLAVIR